MPITAKFFQVHKLTNIQFLEKVKCEVLKIYPLGIMKTFLLHHLEQTSYHSMYERRSFRTSKLTPKVSGLKFFEVHEHTKIQFLKKNKMKFKNLSPENH